MVDRETVTDAVIVPFLQSVVTGGMLGLTAGAAAALANSQQPGIVGLAAGATVASVSWLSYRGGWARRMDALAGIADPIPQQATAYPQTVRLEVITEAGHAGDYLDLPGGERLQALARGLTEGRPLSVRTWCGRGGLYSGPEFDRLRAELIARGLARWNSPHDNKQGCTLTAKGRAVMRGLSDLARVPHPPTIEGIRLEADACGARNHAHTGTQQGRA